MGQPKLRPQNGAAIGFRTGKERKRPLVIRQAVFIRQRARRIVGVVQVSGSLGILCNNDTGNASGLGRLAHTIRVIVMKDVTADSSAFEDGVARPTEVKNACYYPAFVAPNRLDHAFVTTPAGREVIYLPTLFFPGIICAVAYCC